MKNSVIYIDYNFIDDKYPNRPENGDAYYTYGFGSLYARQFKKYLPEWDVQCWKADQFARKITSREIQGVKHIVFPAIKLGRAGFFSIRMSQYARELIKRSPNIIFNISGFDHLLHFQFSRFGNNCPVFVQHHGESPARYKINNSSGIKRIYWQFWSIIENRAFKRTRQLYLLDAEAGKYINISGANFRVSTTGVDTELFVPIEKHTARELLGLKARAKYILFIGRLNASKRADMLISAYLKLKEEIPELELLMGGCNPRDPLYNKARQAGAILTGMIPQNEVKVWLSAADVYSLPLLDTAHKFGGIGMLPVQAMLCNTPVVGSTMKCFPQEFINDVGVFTDNESDLINALRNILMGYKTFPLTRDVALNHYSWHSISEKTAGDYIKSMEELCR